MKIKAISTVLAALLMVGQAVAQSLPPEQIAAMVDQKLNDLNPYQSSKDGLNLRGMSSPA